MAEHAIRLSGAIGRLTAREAKRALAAGAAWGLIMAAGLVLLGFWEHGTLCPGDVVMTAAISIAAGVVAIGPLAAFGGERDA
jgi:hypothetical protein